MYGFAHVKYTYGFAYVSDWPMFRFAQIHPGLARYGFALLNSANCRVENLVPRMDRRRFFQTRFKHSSAHDEITKLPHTMRPEVI